LATPDFLIIGAQKAGTTTLYRDLYAHPNVFLPEQKEPECLTKFGDDFDAIRRDYADLFAPAKSGQIKGEASTSYTKRPTFEGVAERAFKFAGPDLKLIYLKRDPIKRLVSQYRHEVGKGGDFPPIEEAIRRDPTFIDYGRYAWQLEPWVDLFPAENILELSFETYVETRRASLEQVCQFLGLDVALLPDIEEERAFNKSGERTVVRSTMADRFIRTQFYQRRVKPAIPWETRDWIVKTFLPQPKIPDTTLSPETIAWINGELSRRPVSGEGEDETEVVGDSLLSQQR